MARARNVKPGLFKNEILGEADPFYSLLFIGLWTLADKEGRLEYRAKRIRAELFPYKFDLDLTTALDWLNNESFITVYEIGAKKYIQINNWKRHQTPHHKEVESDIPPTGQAEKIIEKHDLTQGQAKHEASMDQQRSNKIASCPTDTGYLIPDSLNSDSITPSSGTSPGTSKGKKFQFTDDDMRAAEYMLSTLLADQPDYKKPDKLDSWADTIRLMRERDGRTHREICQVWIWARRDSFWRANILSAGKLREKYDQLKAKMTTGVTSSGTHQPIDFDNTDWADGIEFETEPPEPNSE